MDSETILKIHETCRSARGENRKLRHRRKGIAAFSQEPPDTLRVFLYAPREDKVRRLLARGKSEKEAEQLVDTVDRERADFIQKYFHVEWPDRAIYHTMINTAIGDEAVVRMILDFKERLPGESHGMTSLQLQHWP